MLDLEPDFAIRQPDDVSTVVKVQIRSNV